MLAVFCLLLAQVHGSFGGAAAAFELLPGCAGIEISNSGYCIKTIGAKYNKYQECTIAVTIDDVTLSVVRFDVEWSYTCSYDSLKVKGKKYCGQVGPEGVEVESLDMMQWSTDDSGQKAGFEICAPVPQTVVESPAGSPSTGPMTGVNAFALSGNCGGIELSTSSSGTCFKTIGETYQPNKECTITATRDVTLSVISFVVEGRGCVYDYLRVKEDVKYCDTSSPDGVKLTRGDIMEWYSDDGDTFAGFEICEVLSTVNDGCPTLTDESTCVKYMDGRTGYENQPCRWCCGDGCTGDGTKGCQPESWLLAQSNYIGKSKNGLGVDACPLSAFSLSVGCGGIELTSSRILGTCFKTIGATYQVNKECTILAMRDVKLSVHSWAVEGYGCAYDYLRINDGTKYCDTSSPSGVELKRGSKMEWYSDDSGTFAGFVICEAPNSADYLRGLGRKCGGVTIDTLQDGTANGYAPYNEDTTICEAKCTGDTRCNGFTWSRSDKKCFWNSGVSASTIHPEQGHDCHSHLGSTITWNAEVCCMTQEQCEASASSVAVALGLSPSDVEVDCSPATGRRRSEEPQAFNTQYTVEAGNGAGKVGDKLNDDAVVDQIGEQIASDTGATINSIKSLGVTRTPGPAPSPDVNCDPFTDSQTCNANVGCVWKPSGPKRTDGECQKSAGCADYTGRPFVCLLNGCVDVDGSCLERSCSVQTKPKRCDKDPVCTWVGTNCMETASVTCTDYDKGRPCERGGCYWDYREKTCSDPQ